LFITADYFCKISSFSKGVITVLSNLRVAGLASGMDTESIIKDLMRAHRAPVDRLQQSRQLLEWQQEAYREINTALRSFRDQVFNMELQSTFLVKSTAVSNENILKAAAGSNAVPGNYTVTVHQLASGVSKGSQVSLSDERKENGAVKTLAEQFASLSGTITFELEGGNNQGSPKSFSFDTSTATIYDVVSEINNAGLGIKASYDAAQDRFFLATKTTGENQYIKVVSDDSHFLSFGGGGDSGDNALQLNLETGIAYHGRNAEIDFGDVTGLTSSTNSITVNGITMDLKSEGTATVTVASDTEAVFNTIVKFIEDYNSTVQTITDKLYEKRYSDYQPLTDEQREQLTDEQIEKWEEKARSGLLRNDTTLSGLAARMRQTMSGVVSGLDGSYDTLVDIGINTTADYMSAKLEVNETKLREALQNDPEAVMNLFTKSSETDSEKGIAQRLYNNLNYGMQQLIDKAGSYSEFSLVDNSLIGKQLEDIDTRINSWEDRLTQIEDRYWRQFTAMEKAIQQMNSQSTWLMQQLGMYGQQ